MDTETRQHTWDDADDIRRMVRRQNHRTAGDPVRRHLANADGADQRGRGQRRPARLDWIVRQEDGSFTVQKRRRR